MAKLDHLTPSDIWKNFEKICSIPHPSKKEKQIIDYMKSFGESLGLETIVDEAGNVIIKKPATPGMENRMGVILQGHLDMVPQKNSDKVHDFEKDPIEPIIDGEWVKANGTTLGADNGIGAAAAMAVLEAKNLVHGPIEGLFTIDEETGMTGAFELKAGVLNGDILLNLDSEDEGELYIGCAGGVDANVTFKYRTESMPAGCQAYKLSITGLKGGHSGLDINLGRGNANKLLLRFLKHAIKEFGIKLVSFEGGSLRNAIPREGFAVVVVPSAKANQLADEVKKFNAIFKHELGKAEPTLSFEIATAETPNNVMNSEDCLKIINSSYACPNGVIRMSDVMPGIVETSNNLAIMKSQDGKFTLNCLLRSSVDSAKADLGEMISSLFELAGAEVELTGEYPGWKPNADSAILKTMSEVYNNNWGKKPEIKVIHAGLECGILGANYPRWDMISFGPTIRFPHSPDEKVNIPSVQKFWDFLVVTLKSIPQK
ncbi:MAG: cytosol nonspecific dipeptidase [Bacteroidetes bacterium HGW-Bacteroidetes-21]|jgi:dipeptidase D|nr:MAG: cytosol nonspecific dipeptidase [Bacteroidetes bacterium HGW-Bacteroidetes-21]